MLRKYFNLAPHEQFIRGMAGLAIIYILQIPLFFLWFFFFGIEAFGSNSPHIFSGAVIFMYALFILAMLVLGLLLPMIRMLILSHKMGRNFGRGDEHIIFYLGIILSAASFLFRRQALISEVPNKGEFNSMWFTLHLTSFILGLLLVLAGMVLLYRLSRIYSGVSQGSSPKQ